MATGKNFALVQKEPERHNEHLPGDQAFTSQHTLLQDSEDEEKLIAHIGAYLDRAYYSLYWATTMSEAELIALAEECLVAYEQECPDGVPDLKGELTDPQGKANFEEKIVSGVIYFTRHEGEGEKGELDYQRPLRWEQIVAVANGKEITLGRFNTPIGDFLVDQYGSTRIMGVISHIKATAPFVKLLVESSSEGITMEQATQLVDTGISGFPLVENIS